MSSFAEMLKEKDNLIADDDGVFHFPIFFEKDYNGNWIITNF